MNEELIDYILNHYSNFMNEDEQVGFRFLKTDLKSQADNDLKNLIEDLLKDGSESFRKSTAKRIMQENREKIILNYCPNCGRIARTPTARQCRHCGHQWRT